MILFEKKPKKMCSQVKLGSQVLVIRNWTDLFGETLQPSTRLGKGSTLHWCHSPGSSSATVRITVVRCGQHRASFQQGEYLSEEPTCDHRSLITLTLLRDLGGGDAADHGQYPSPWDLPPQEAGFSKLWLHLSMEKALLLTPHLFRADPGFPRPVAL